MRQSERVIKEYELACFGLNKHLVAFIEVPASSDATVGFDECLPVVARCQAC